MTAISAARPRPARQDAGEGGARRLAGALLLAQFAAMWTAFGVLAPAIDWPASLDAPAAVMLPLVVAKSGAVFAGYASYLAHALILIPLAVALRPALGLGAIAGGLAVALGVLAGFAKALGIVRWLFLTPTLAAAYVDPAASPATRDAIAVVHDAFNAYAGGIGEALGVGLFAGLWTVVVASALVRGGARIIGCAGFGAAALLFTTLPSVVGLESALLLTLSGVVWQVWTAALAVRLLRGPVIL